ncbi:unnamed protein product [Effrenium voratum]|nr:unnamed protein product [Effrenium voratum]
MFCSKFAAAVWSSTIGNPTAQPAATPRAADLKKMCLQSLDHSTVAYQRVGEEVLAELFGRCIERDRLASWACRLESLLGLLLRVAQTPSGAALLVEQRVFVLLAYCPLLRHFVLNTDSPYMVPSNTFDSASLVSERQWVTWRRPAHSAWCRVLLLVATILASGATSEEAEVFLQVYNKRFCFVFQTSLQSGHMAVLEEASLMGRVLAFLCQRSAVARSLAAEAAAQAMVFVMNSCLTERSRPSEVFLPRSGEERLAAQVPEMAVGEIPAQAPSIFHQRVEYLGLELLRNLLLALLRISSLPQWLSLAQAATKVTEINPAQGWPTAYQSVFGLKDAGGTAALNAAESDPVRLWAVLMDVTMETGKKAAEYLETLNGQRQEMHRLTIANSAMEADAGDAWLPLSLALVGIGELGAPDGPASPGFASPQAAPGQTPLATAWSPTLPPVTEPRTSNRVRALRYKFAARRPNATPKAQSSSGFVPCNLYKLSRQTSKRGGDSSAVESQLSLL